ncbi:MAG: carboxypeptidase regulatory-like domain-containing protein [Candidatus Hydrogenedentota bacterium]
MTFRVCCMGVLTAMFGMLLLAQAPVFGEVLSGTVSVEGRMPPMGPIKMAADPHCEMQHKDMPVLNESIVVDEENHLANVFVQVVEGLPDKEYPTPAEPAELSQSGCMYHPRVFGIRVGQPLVVLNPDGNIHNVNGMPQENPGFNRAMDDATEEQTVVFEKPEPAPFPIKCDVHPWMRAYCAVLTHPYFDVSNTAGRYTIDALPPGDYVVEAWHERLGVRRKTITVAEGEPATADFVLSR